LQLSAVDLAVTQRRTVFDFTSGATPHEVASGHPELTVQRDIGLVIALGAGAALRVPSGAPFKDGSARLEGLVLDPDAGMDVGLRFIDAGRAQLGYLLQARPALSEFRVIRFAQVDSTPAGQDVLLPWTACRMLRAMGEVNRIELLAADSLLQVRINDALVARLDDPRFGYGVPMYGASSHGQPARVTLRRFEHGLL